MELKITATSGTLESSDIQIIMEPSDGGIEIELESTVKTQFGDQIEKTIKDTLRSMNIRDAKVTANDKGAIDPVIISRVQTAVYRSAQNTNYKWA